MSRVCRPALISAATPPLPAGKYRVIYADPPWRFETYSAKGKGRSAEQHYACMSIDDIKALPVGSLAAKDCVLLMWITNPNLPVGLEVIRAWGFKYQTVGFTWIKRNGSSATPRAKACLWASATGRAPTPSCACWQPRESRSGSMPVSVRSF